MTNDKLLLLDQKGPSRQKTFWASVLLFSLAFLSQRGQKNHGNHQTSRAGWIQTAPEHFHQVTDDLRQLKRNVYARS